MCDKRNAKNIRNILFFIFHLIEVSREIESEQVVHFIKREGKNGLDKMMLTSLSDVCDRFVVAVADAAVVVKLWDGTDGVFGFALRQCLSYRMPNNTMKYSINAKNTNSVHDISHTYSPAAQTNQNKWEKKNRDRHVHMHN